MVDDFQQDDMYTISDLETLKVIADPFRLQILELMVDNPITVKVIADVLEVKPNKLYYHVNLLEKHGLIRVVRTEVVSGIIEKWYQTIAKSFMADPNLLMGSEDAAAELGPIIDSILEATRRDLAQTLQRGRVPKGEADMQRAMIVSRELLYLTAAQQAAFKERLRALLAEFAAHSEPNNPQAEAIAATLLVFPLIRGERENTNG